MPYIWNTFFSECFCLLVCLFFSQHCVLHVSQIVYEPLLLALLYTKENRFKPEQLSPYGAFYTMLSQGTCILAWKVIDSWLLSGRHRNPHSWEKKDKFVCLCLFFFLKGTEQFQLVSRVMYFTKEIANIYTSFSRKINCERTIQGKESKHVELPLIPLRGISISRR